MSIYNNKKENLKSVALEEAWLSGQDPNVPVSNVILTTVWICLG